MSQRQIIILIGVIIMVLPFLGFPIFWKQMMLLAIGLFIVVSAFRISGSHEAHADTFSESHNHLA